ncbi:Uncharacterized protein APZ42_004653 [Daphnia magna]|uniref:Uncharacterized protein n=1 Tax=Daphnia magna TaxID=35525 RepID=A0A162F053_9CRUS|nr:Uncharacterized protein APZ42_004653 [Daphnia magna]
MVENSGSINNKVRSIIYLHSEKVLAVAIRNYTDGSEAKISV